jgi:hypothetical protein
MAIGLSGPANSDPERTMATSQTLILADNHVDSLRLTQKSAQKSNMVMRRIMRQPYNALILDINLG